MDMDTITPQGSMKRIWFVVFGSVFMCFAIGMAWHFSIMGDLEDIAEAEKTNSRNATLGLAAYRNVLKVEGVEAGRNYLDSQKLLPYGN